MRARCLLNVAAGQPGPLPQATSEQANANTHRHPKQKVTRPNGTAQSLADSITDIVAHPTSTYCTLAVNPATTRRIAILATWAFAGIAADCFLVFWGNCGESNSTVPCRCDKIIGASSPLFCDLIYAPGHFRRRRYRKAYCLANELPVANGSTLSACRASHVTAPARSPSLAVPDTLIVTPVTDGQPLPGLLRTEGLLFATGCSTLRSGQVESFPTNSSDYRQLMRG